MSIHSVPNTENSWGKIAVFIVRKAYIKKLNGTKDECATYGAKEQGQCLTKETTRVIEKYCTKTSPQDPQKCSSQLSQAIRTQTIQYKSVLEKHTRVKDPFDAEIRTFPQRNIRKWFGMGSYITFEAPNPRISISKTKTAVVPTPNKPTPVVKPDASIPKPDAGVKPDSTSIKPDAKITIKPAVIPAGLRRQANKTIKELLDYEIPKLTQIARQIKTALKTNNEKETRALLSQAQKEIKKVRGVQ